MSPASSAVVIRLPGRLPMFGRYVVGSAAVHVAAVLLLLLLPGGGSSAIPSDALTVNLVAAAPGPRVSPPAAARRSASAPPAATKGARLETAEVKPAKRKRPKPVVQKKKPAPAKETPPQRGNAGPGGSSPPAVGPVPAGGGGTGAAVGEGAGSITFLQGDPEMAWYSATVIGALRSEWTRPILQGLRQTLSVRVAFEISRDGTVRNVRVEESSGVLSLDRSALRAVADASPFPPLPPGWREALLPAAIEFRLNPETP